MASMSARVQSKVAAMGLLYHGPCVCRTAFLHGIFRSLAFMTRSASSSPILSRRPLCQKGCNYSVGICAWAWDDSEDGFPV